MKKVNVLHIIGDLNTGGAQALVRDYARLLDYNRFNLFILTVYPPIAGANVDMINNTGARIISIYPQQTLPYQLLNKIAPKFAISNRLSKILKEFSIDVIHVHLAHLKYLVPISKCLGNIRLLYTCHSLPSQFFSGANISEYKAAKKLIKENALQMIALHENMRKEINEMFGIENTIVIKNGVEFDRFIKIDEDKRAIRRSLNIPEDAFVIGHVGRFAYMKNHSFLVDVFKEVYNLNSKAWLLMVGSGPLVQDTMSKVESFGLSKYTTHLENRTDIPRLLKAMDVFVFPSTFEGLPVSVVEAQVAGLRVVCSNKITEECCFLPSLVTLDLTDSSEQWANCVLDNSAKGAYNKDISSFDMKKEIKRLESYYQK